MGLIYIFHVQHYRFVGDDAFIRFRYFANLARGQGLVWNPGEYVEGYKGSTAVDDELWTGGCLRRHHGRRGSPPH